MVEAPRSPSARRGLRPVLLTTALAAVFTMLGANSLGPTAPISGPSVAGITAQQVRPPALTALELRQALLEAPAEPLVEDWRFAAPTAPEPEAPRQVDIAPQFVPLPVPRPSELRGPDGQRRGERRQARDARATAPMPVPEEPSFLDKLFGIQRAPALAYAALPNGGGLAPAQAPRLSPTPAPEGGGVAVYDITARRVTLPNGERLEAHSGLGNKMDDPNFVHVRMRGPTPPGTYDLSERESLFHGVRAIRMTPVGGNAAIYGRDGILAHTYMLGPKGASNGCVSFKEYDRFLQAYLRGEITRLVVVTGRGRDTAPALAGRGTGRLARLGQDG